MNTQQRNNILLIALYGFIALCFAVITVFTIKLFKTAPMIPIGYILLTITLIILFIKQLLKLK